MAGFCGALVIIRPGTDIFQPAALLTLLSAVCFAGYQLWTRRLAPHERPETLIVYTALAGAVIMSVAAPFGVRPPDGILDGLKFAGVGLLGGGGAVLHHLRPAQSGRRPSCRPSGMRSSSSPPHSDTPSSATSPTATPGSGAALIVGSGLIVAWRERARRQAQ